MSGKVLTLLTLPLYTRVLTPEEYGLVAFGTAIALVAGIFGTLALPGAAARFVLDAHTLERRQRLLGTLFGTVIGTTVLTTVVLAVVFPRTAGDLLHYADSARLLTALLCAAVGFRALAQLFSAYGLALKRHERVAVGELSEVGVSHLLWIALSLSGILTPTSYFAGMAVGALISFCLLAFNARREIGASWDFRIALEAAAFALPLAVHSMAYYGVHYLDRLLLPEFVSAADLGRYHLTYSLVFAPFAVVMLAVKAWTPIANLGFQQGNPHVYRAMSDAVVYSGALLGACIVVGLPLLQPRLFATAYQPPTGLIAALVAAEMLYLIYIASATPLAFYNKHRVLPWITLTALMLNVVGLLTLAPTYGLLGAAFATVAALGFLGVGTAIVAQVRTGESIRLPAAVVLAAAGGVAIGYEHLPKALAVPALIGVATWTVFRLRRALRLLDGRSSEGRSESATVGQ